MSIFRKGLDESGRADRVTPAGEVRSPSAPAARSYVAPGTRIEGSISGDTEVLVDGSLVGSVELDGRCVLGRRGQVDGDIAAKSVQIAGTVEGDVRAEEKIEVTSSGSVKGDLVAPLVSIAEGGVCNGRIEMSGTLAIDSPAAEDVDAETANSGGVG